MNCLKDYIGLQACSTTTPDSGVYVNQLPGIELEMIDGIADEQQVDFNGVWDDVQERAVRRLKTDLNAEFKKRYRLKNITQSVDLGRLIDTTSTTVSAGDYRGVSLTLNKSDENYSYSNLQTFYIPDLSLYFSSNNATTIKIFDLRTGTELYTKSVAAPGSIGWQTIQINQTFTSREIFVSYDATNLNSVLLDLTKFNYKEGNNAELRGATATISASILESDLTTSDNAYGLSVKWSVICSFDSFVCQNKEPFLRSLWLLLGIELSRERRFTSRLNEFTAFGQDRAKELMQMFEIEYRGGVMDEIHYEGELFMSIDAINLNKSDYCIECNDEVRIMEMI